MNCYTSYRPPNGVTRKTKERSDAGYPEPARTVLPEVQGGSEGV